MIVNRNIYFVHDDNTAELRCGDSCVLLDGDDVEQASKYQWSIGTHGYATSGAGKDQILLHRLLSNAKSTDTVDHINRNKLDNRKSNLRICNTQQNCINKGKQNGNNPYKGISRVSDGKWQAQIVFNKRAIYLGRYDDPVIAAKAYDTAARELFGEYAYLNFPDSTEQIRQGINRRKKFTKDEVYSIRYLYSIGHSIPSIATTFGHSYTSIHRIVRNKTFKELN